jgi:hypothetical protein
VNLFIDIGEKIDSTLRKAIQKKVVDRIYEIKYSNGSHHSLGTEKISMKLSDLDIGINDLVFEVEHGFTKMIEHDTVQTKEGFEYRQVVVDNLNVRMSMTEGAPTVDDNDITFVEYSAPNIVLEGIITVVNIHDKQNNY